MTHNLRQYLKPNLGDFIIAILCVITEATLEALLPFLMNRLIKFGLITKPDLTYEMDLKYTILIASIMVVLALLAFVFGVLSAKFSAKACRGFGYELRKAQYKKIQEYSFNNLDDFRSSSLITRLTTDVQILSDTLCTSLRPAVRAPLFLVYALVFSIIISPTLSVVFLCSLVFLSALITTIILLIKPRFLKIQKLVDNINLVTQESIIAIKTIKAYAKKEFELEKFEKANSELKGQATITLRINALTMPASQMANYATIIAIIYFGGLMYMQTPSAIMLEDIQTFLTYVMQILATVIMLSNVLLSINRATASYHRIGEVMSTESEIINNKNDLKVQNGSISFKNVSFKYKKKAQESVIKNINLEIESGEYVGIVGQTGSSKSTLVSLIDRFYDVSEGEILISGKNIKEYELKNLRDEISISFQNPTLFEGTVLDNLLWGNKNATMDEVIEACKIAECYDFIINDLKDKFNTYVAQGGTSLSGGQKQRVCIARAILKHPKILILDDSFSALDRVTENKVNNNLISFLPGTTKIIISQKISAIRNADKIIVLDNGKVSSIGTHENLIKTDAIYKDLATLQGVMGESYE